MSILTEERQKFLIANRPVDSKGEVFELRDLFLFELYQELVSSRALFVIQTNSMTASEYRSLKLRLREKGFHTEMIKNNVFKEAITLHEKELVEAGTTNVAQRMEDFRNLIVTKLCVVYSNIPDHEQPTLLKDFADIAAKFPKKTLVVGAKLDGMVLTSDMLKEVVKMPSLSHLRAELVGLLSYPSQSLVSVLQRRPQELLMALTQHHKNLEGGSEDGGSATA
ncbi:hypothetical protein HK097_000766 [Rhizophlyctis rosea]|uniref:50S ribosomal protein L10 n=1 Tax=Rhizophlyctis rosea TaxID=64517 RepID=A0AAD5S7N2_9FUNG|nr:hypothetical protein HK097_000766 [Rhizophlyctis rosea]